MIRLFLSIPLLAALLAGLSACGHARSARDPRESSDYAHLRLSRDRFNLKVCECRTGYCDEYYSVTENERREYVCGQQAYEAVDPSGEMLRCFLLAEQRGGQCIARLGCESGPLDACMDQRWEAEEACAAPTAEQQARLNEVASSCLGRPFVVFDPTARTHDVDE